MLSWRLFFVFFFVYRCAMAVLGEFVVRSLTPLGDAEQYQRSTSIFQFVESLGTFGNPTGVRSLSSAITESVGGLFHSLFGGNPVMIDIGFQSIAFFGLCKLLLALTPQLRGPVALLLLTPSFNLWSSVASKEAIVVFAMAIAARYIYRIHAEQSFRFGFLEVLALLLLWIFKNNYLPAIIFTVGVCVLAQHVHQKTFVALTAGLVSLLGIFIFQEQIAELSFAVQRNWGGGLEALVGQSTRGLFFQQPEDVFVKAPIGMWLSFMGPTLGEVSRGLLHKVSFAESVFLLGFLAYYTIVRLPVLPLYNAVLGSFSLFWLFFGSYPFGVMNPGSAIRYRTGYLVFIVIVVLFVMSRPAYLKFASRRQTGGAKSRIRASHLQAAPTS